MPQALALARSTHPLPTLAVSSIAVILGIGIGLEPWRLVVLALVFLANQTSVGLSNDSLDAERDRAVGRTDKPVATGSVSVRAARTAAFTCAATAITLSFALGWRAAIAQFVFLAAGWSYNVWLKRTPASVVPYVVGFGSIPLIITLSRAEPAWASFWAILAGSLLGVAAHFANVLPDLDDDRVTGITGLPHRFGKRASGILIAVALAGASASIVFGLGDATPLQYAGLGLVVLIGLAAAVVVIRRPESRSVFRLIILAALVTVVLLALSGGRLVA